MYGKPAGDNKTILQEGGEKTGNAETVHYSSVKIQQRKSTCDVQTLIKYQACKTWTDEPIRKATGLKGRE